jgi:peptidoglycan/LPS O-acetylase OafA/YrhL
MTVGILVSGDNSVGTPDAGKVSLRPQGECGSLGEWTMGDKMTQPKASRLTRPGYYPVLDAMRFVLALWVAVGHYKMIPVFGDPAAGTGFWHMFKHAWSTVVFGTPAVVVFFVISGFCIHLPFQGAARIDVVRYYLRRYTRILIPVAAALVVYRFMGSHLTLRGGASILWNSPLWSLACEEIYYALYPLLRWGRNKAGWRMVMPVSFLVAVALAATHPSADGWQVFGPFSTAMILLPVWLLGCLLAEQAEKLSEADRHLSIWFWRFLAWLGCWSAEMLHFKAHIYYTQTMVWFGVLAYFWVREEIANGKTHSPSRYLVAAGAWSYSLYLMHWYGETIVGYLGLTNLGGLVDWFLIMAANLIFSYLFYLAVERPSHSLARKIKVRGTRQTVEQIPVPAQASAG